MQISRARDRKLYPRWDRGLAPWTHSVPTRKCVYSFCVFSLSTARRVSLTRFSRARLRASPQWLSFGYTRRVVMVNDDRVAWPSKRMKAMPIAETNGWTLSYLSLNVFQMLVLNVTYSLWIVGVGCRLTLFVFSYPSGSVPKRFIDLGNASTRTYNVYVDIGMKSVI